MRRRRTYWHLEGSGKKPSTYEIATTRLLYYPARGYEVQTPVAAWQRRHVDEGSVRCRDWDAFHDPRETTYASYTERQQRKEIFLDGLLEAAQDSRLDPAWVKQLERVLPVLRYPFHGLQMVAAYLGSIVPGGRVVVAFLFQAADEMRRVQRLAYRMRQLQETFPGFGDGARAAWEEDPLWQPWRRVVEKLLVVRDLGEALAALNLVVKPAFEELFLGRLAARALAAGDEVMHHMCRSFAEDGAWHAEWTATLCAMLESVDAGNGQALAEAASRWQPAVAEAVAAWTEVLGPEGNARAA